ncbi:hypothetical protein GTO91_10305 [Heliobacterium undosum]|uniref:Uncharacterized protein n=1 Tax=Heliomicrobium undosum TaxID=121734 RepID=A0A845L8P7_9FIRM|nr:hypothetical protein [Heliomicrobium undosum]MZP30098.1 hypothetical protein [Heliomicrobium undosum]
MFPTEQLQGLLLQPFSFVYHRSDVHVMVYMRDHPKYESLEAMIRLREGSDPLIRAIITLHDQSQVDHVNDERVVEQRQREGLKREIHFRSIGYKRTMEDGIVRIQLAFDSFCGEPIRLDFVAAGKTSSRWGGSINPGQHARTSSLPVMFRARSTLAGKRSRLLIAGKEYTIPRFIWIPFFFTGLKGYYSEVFDMAVFRSGSRQIRFIEQPEKGVPGERWRYAINGSEIDYVITARNDEHMDIQSVNHHLIVTSKNGRPALRAIGAISETVASGTGHFAAQFEPPLPLPSLFGDPLEKKEQSDAAAPSAQVLEGRFSLSIDDRELVYGKTTFRENAEEVEIRLLPGSPRWAALRPITMTAKIHGGTFLLSTAVDRL